MSTDGKRNTGGNQPGMALSQEMCIALGQVIDEWRRAKGLKAWNLAENAGISPRTLSEIENGHFRTGRDPETFARIAKALGKTGEGLFQEARRRVNWGQNIDLSRLPPVPGPFVNRAKELQLLDEAWADHQRCHVVVIVAPYGEGKSALVREWLARMQESRYGGAEAVCSTPVKAFLGRGCRSHCLQRER